MNSIFFAGGWVYVKTPSGSLAFYEYPRIYHVNKTAKYCSCAHTIVDIHLK